MPPLPAADERLHTIHYSSGLMGEHPGQSPPISAITVHHCLTGHQTTFAALFIAEERGIPPGEFRDRHPEFERELLHQLRGFVAARPDAVWLHWGMKGAGFGFDALAHRARIHGVEPIEIPVGRRFDLAHYLKRRFGDDCLPHPRLESAIRFNLGAVPHYLNEEAARQAWQREEYAAVIWSLNAKVKAVAKLFERVQQGTFRALFSCGDGPPLPPDEGERPEGGGRGKARGKGGRTPTVPAKYKEAVKLWPVFAKEMKAAGKRPRIEPFRAWLRKRPRPVIVDDDYPNWWNNTYSRELRRCSR